MPTKKRKFPGPWRKTYDEFKHFIVYPRMHGAVEVVAVREVGYVRVTNRYGDREESRETVHGPYLREALKRIHLSDKQESTHLMLEHGLELVQKIFDRYSWYLRRAEMQNQERRKAAYKKRKAEMAEKRVDDDLKKRAGKQFCRRIEV